MSSKFVSFLAVVICVVMCAVNIPAARHGSVINIVACAVCATCAVLNLCMFIMSVIEDI